MSDPTSLPHRALARLRGRIGAARLASDAGVRVAGPPQTDRDAGSGPLPPTEFVNPFAEGADPFVIRDGDGYLWCATAADRGVVVGRSDRLTSLGVRRVVWTAPESGPISREVWAPELLRLDGRWHIYFAASDGHNATHLAYVLRALSDDPQGDYELLGPLDTGDEPGQPQWAIDMTVLEHGGRRYALWSGWPGSREQHLYGAPMSDPVTVVGPRTLLTSPRDFDWERIRDDDPEGINEGPQVLCHDGRTFVVFSCGSALLPSYKLGLLELVGDDPLDPAHWHKHPEPIFTSTATTFGVGHGTFVGSPDDEQTWLVYHRKIEAARNFKRVLQAQPVTWGEDGLPRIGPPVDAGLPVAVPSGTPVITRGDGGRWSFGSIEEVGADFDYFGHQQFIAAGPDGLELGRLPEHPVNAFRSAEKVVLRDARWADVSVAVTIDHREGSGYAGILLRCTAPGVGRNAQRGYFVGWNDSRRRLSIVLTDGQDETALARVRVPGANGPVRLVVEASGSTIRGWVEGHEDAAVEAADDTYAVGSVGLRVAANHSGFTDLVVTPG